MVPYIYSSVHLFNDICWSHIYKRGNRQSFLLEKSWRLHYIIYLQLLRRAESTNSLSDDYLPFEPLLSLYNQSTCCKNSAARSAGLTYSSHKTDQSLFVYPVGVLHFRSCSPTMWMRYNSRWRVHHVRSLEALDDFKYLSVTCSLSV